MGRIHDKEIIVAAHKGHTERVARLLDDGASPNARGRYGYSPLREAASQGHLETVKLLLEAGASIDLTDGENATALYWAASNGHTEVVKLLLAKGAKINTIRDCGYSVLTPVIMNGDEELAIVLMQCGANPDVVAHGETMYEWAVRYGREKVVRYLLKNGYRPRPAQETVVDRKNARKSWYAVVRKTKKTKSA